MKFKDTVPGDVFVAHNGLSGNKVEYLRIDGPNNVVCFASFKLGKILNDNEPVEILGKINILVGGGNNHESSRFD